MLSSQNVCSLDLVLSPRPQTAAQTDDGDFTGGQSCPLGWQQDMLPPVATAISWTASGREDVGKPSGLSQQAGI